MSTKPTSQLVSTAKQLAGGKPENAVRVVSGVLANGASFQGPFTEANANAWIAANSIPPNPRSFPVTPAPPGGDTSIDEINNVM